MKPQRDNRLKRHGGCTVQISRTHHNIEMHYQTKRISIDTSATASTIIDIYIYQYRYVAVSKVLMMKASTLKASNASFPAGCGHWLLTLWTAAMGAIVWCTFDCSRSNNGNNELTNNWPVSWYSTSIIDYSQSITNVGGMSSRKTIDKKTCPCRNKSIGSSTIRVIL